MSGLLNTKTVIATLGYYALSMVLYKILPGQDIDGTALRGGGKLKYRFNGAALPTVCDSRNSS